MAFLIDDQDGKVYSVSIYFERMGQSPQQLDKRIEEYKQRLSKETKSSWKIGSRSETKLGGETVILVTYNVI